MYNKNPGLPTGAVQIWEYNSQMGIIGSPIGNQNKIYTDSDDWTNVKYKIKIVKVDNQSACNTVYTCKCIYTSLLL